MALQTNVESLQVRFGLQLDLLRELFNTRNLTFGTPEDIAAFAERLDVPGTFADDTRALLTGVICTEEPALTRMELLDLLCLAVGGTTADGSGTALQPVLWQILIFINGVLLSSRHSPLPVTVETPARSAKEAPQVDGFEQDSYVLERFDLPSDRTWGVGGRDGFGEDLEDILSPDANYTCNGTKSPDGIYKPYSIDTEFLARADFARGPANETGGPSGDFETVLLVEEPASTAKTAHTSTSATSPVVTDLQRRGALLRWPVSLTCAAAVGFLLGTLVPRYAKPCSAAPLPHRANRSATSAVVPGLSRVSVQRSKPVSAALTEMNDRATGPDAAQK